MIIFVILAIFFFVFGIPYLISSAVDPIGTSELIDSIFKKKKKYNVQDEMSFFNDAEWVKKAILSCTNRYQWRNTDKLISFLCNKYKKKVKSETVSDIEYRLRDISIIKRQKLL